jgi:hypothetical protein
VPAFIFVPPKSVEDLLDEPRSPRIHTLPLQEYTRLSEDKMNADGTPVLHEVTERDLESMERIEAFAREQHQAFLDGKIDMVEIASPEESLRFFIERKSHHVLMTSDDLETIYGVKGAWLLVFEEARGQGLGKFIHLAMDGFYDKFGGPATCFSPAGYGNRLATHREAVIRAHEQGLDDIHPENLERYAECLPRTAPTNFGPQ